MNKAFLYESLTEETLHEALRIESECFPCDPWGESAVRTMMNAPDTEYFLWRRLTDPNAEELIGSIVYRITEQEAELYKIAVLPEHRGNGYGGKMLRRMLNYIKSAGSPTVFLEVREGNAAARALYEKNGFTVDGIRKNYYKSPSENAVLMSLDMSKYERP